MSRGSESAAIERAIAADLMPAFDRRRFLTRLGSFGLAGAAGIGVGQTGAHAAAAHTFPHGEVEITVVSDGHLTLAVDALVRNVEPARLAAVLALTDQSAQVSAPTNVTLVKTKSDLILIDAGSGPNFMPTAGKLADNLASLGVDRTKVTKVVFTHGHPDHLWGTIDEFEDAPTFANASYVISAGEWNLWMSDDVLTKIPADRQNSAPGAKRNLSRIKDKVRTIKPGEDIAAGMRAIDTRGHTQGHISIEIAGGREPLIVLGDALTHPLISFAYPGWTPAADHEPDLGVATRMKLLDRLASDRSPVIGYHLPFPGRGRVERRGGAFAFVPSV
ncbi:MAG TPA: MBL fold metallo-hydrolase [Hyphomicrobiaceae bacterium]|nr:MBL fold metallo-hydrolase [Hyphomicrobiaceae bacterium]